MGQNDFSIQVKKFNMDETACHWPNLVAGATPQAVDWNPFYLWLFCCFLCLGSCMKIFHGKTMFKA